LALLRFTQIVGTKKNKEKHGENLLWKRRTKNLMNNLRLYGVHHIHLELTTSSRGPEEDDRAIEKSILELSSFP
jgi:hypothetical protein